MNVLELQSSRFENRFEHDRNDSQRSVLRLWIAGLQSLRVFLLDEPQQATKEIKSILSASDEAAFEGDWQQVGRDIRAAINQYWDEHSSDLGEPLRYENLLNDILSKDCQPLLFTDSGIKEEQDDE